MSRNNDYKNGNSSDFAYFKENYRLIAIDLSKQSKFLSKLFLLVDLKDKATAMGQQCFSSLKNQRKLLLNFYKIL